VPRLDDPGKREPVVRPGDPDNPYALAWPYAPGVSRAWSLDVPEVYPYRSEMGPWFDKPRYLKSISSRGALLPGPWGRVPVVMVGGEPVVLSKRLGPNRALSRSALGCVPGTSVFVPYPYFLLPKFLREPRER